MAINPTDKPTTNPDIVLGDEFDDWTILFHPRTGEAIGVDPVGAAIWKRLDGLHTLAEVAAEIKAQCEEDAPDTVLEDTLAFVNDLEQRLFVIKAKK